MGTVIVDGKIYNLKELSLNELQELEKSIKEKKKDYEQKIDKLLSNRKEA